jgi:tetratricopeptide (TPR) repeat protein
MSMPAARKLFCAMSGVILSAGAVFAGSYSNSAVGTSAGKFLSLGSSARAAAMGEAYCAVTQDADAVRYNPAAMVRIKANSAQLMHANYLASTFLDQGSFARRMGANHALGLSVLQMSYGDIAETDETGYETGTAKPANLALTAAYGYKLNNFGGILNGGSVGFSVSYIRSVIVSSAKTFAGSFGILSPVYGPYETVFALTAENLGGALKHDQKSDPLPVMYRLGGLTHIRPDWILALDLFAPRDNSPYVAVGTEKWFKAQSSPGLAIRAGYNTLRTRDLDGLAGFSAGLGIAFQSAVIDYAFVPFGALGYAHRLMLTFSFGQGGDDSSESEWHPKTKRVPVVDSRPEPELEQEVLPASTAEVEQVVADPEVVVAAKPNPKMEQLYRRRVKVANKYFEQRNYSNAAREYKQAVKLLPENDERRVFVYAQQGQIGLKLKRVAIARDFYLAAIQVAKKLDVTSTHLTNSYLGLAYCFERLGNTGAAVKNYEKALELTSNPRTKSQIMKSLQKLRGNP